MTSPLRTAGLLASAALVLTIAGSALAADPPGREVKVERKVIIQRGGPDGGGMRWAHRDPEAHAQKLRDILQLRPDQEPALQAFIAATAPPKPMRMMDGHKGPDGQGGPPDAGDMPMRQAMTTPERLDMQARMMAEHQAAFEKRAAAIKTFYAALSPSQRKAFDALHAGGMGGHRMLKMRMRGPEGGPPGGMAMFEGDDDDDQ